MSKIRREVELAIRLGNTPGALGRILSLVAAEGVNILAYCAYSERAEGVVLLVTDNPAKAKDSITSAGYECRANSVILIGGSDQVGGAALIGARLGFAGVDILYSYASSSGGDEFFAVFKTNDDDRAMHILSDFARTSHAA